jgi:hypothetical protein
MRDSARVHRWLRILEIPAHVGIHVPAIAALGGTMHPRCQSGRVLQRRFANRRQVNDGDAVTRAGYRNEDVIDAVVDERIIVGRQGDRQRDAISQVAQVTVKHIDAVRRRLEEQSSVRTELRAVNVFDVQNFSVVQRVVGFPVQIRIVNVKSRGELGLIARERQFVVAIATTITVKGVEQHVGCGVDAKDLTVLVVKNTGVVRTDRVAAT